MKDSDLQNRIAFIKERWKIFLEKKLIDKEENFKKTNYLDLAETKKDLSYLIKAREIVLDSAENIKEKGVNLNLNDEVLYELTREVFERIVPKKIKNLNKFLKEEIHKGNYHSRDTHKMIAGKFHPSNSREYDLCWEVLSNEYFSMNICGDDDSGDNYSSYEFRSNKYNYESMSLVDIMGPSKD